jgi:hypothetical protein
MRNVLLLVGLGLALAGCATDRQTAGTATGAVAGAVVGGPVGAVVGGAAGAAVTAPGAAPAEVVTTRQAPPRKRVVRKKRVSPA